MTFSEVKKIAFLFNGDLGGRWYPLHGVRKLPKNKRKESIIEFSKTGYKKAEELYWLRQSYYIPPIEKNR